MREVEYELRDLGAETTRKEQEKEQLEYRMEQISRKLVDLQETKEHFEGLSKTTQKQHAEKQQALANWKTKLEQAGVEKEHLAKERASIMEVVQNGQCSKRQVEREQRLSAVAQEMTRKIPGVYGRVCDLCKPIQKRLRVAVNVALGGHADTVLVDSSDTCRRCVKYLKDNQIEPMTFLPLRTEDLRMSDPLPMRVEQSIKTGNLRLLRT